MALHGVCFFDNANDAALTAVPPLADETVFVSGNDLMVPAAHAAISAVIAIGDTLSRVVIDSPKIRTISRFDLGYIDSNAAPTEHSRYNMPLENMLPVEPGEALNVLAQNTGNAAAKKFIGLWLADGPIQPITGADFRTVRGSVVMDVAADAWTSGQIVLETDLPAGRYAVIGFRVVLAGGVFARLIFPEQGLRPMAVVSQAEGQDTGLTFRYGKLGTLGTFQNFVPPKLEVLANAAVSNPVVYLDVVRTGA